MSPDAPTPSPGPSPVAAVAAADPADAHRHFSSLLAYETDCWDVHEAIRTGTKDFVLLQTNGTAESFRAGHLPEALHLPHADITEDTLARWPADTLFVVYCSGPHCNGADRGAARIAALGRRVKKMIGGRVGWLDEGFDLVTD